MRTTSARKLIGGAQLATSTVEGVALSTIVLQATVEVGLPDSTVGMILAAGAASAMLLAMPLGHLADRWGLGRATALFAAVGASALVGYALMGSPAGFGVAAIAFAVAQSSSAAARQALAVAGAPPQDRLVIRATMHTLLNVGIGVGTVIGAILAATGLGPNVRVAYAAGAIVMAATAAVALTLPRPPHRPTRSTGSPVAAAWRDPRFALASGLAAVIQLTMPVLAVILPLWLIHRTAAPVWLPGVALAVNTILVIAFQRPAAARVATPRATSRTAVAAAVGLALAGMLLAASSVWTSPGVVVAIVLTGIAALTLGEVCGGIATWRVALDDVPAEAEGRYQAAFAMSTGLARIAGPALALPLVMTLGPAGWLILTTVMALACLGIAGLARSQSAVSRRIERDAIPELVRPATPASLATRPAHHRDSDRCAA
jgi:MFS family permease